MKKALVVFEDLLDGFQYTIKNWLHFDLNDATFNDGVVIAAASAFLFDNLFAKENAGPEITSAAAEAMGADFKPEKLSQLATKMRVAMAGDDFSLGTSPLREYIRWISDAEPTVEDAYADDFGKLSLMTIEEMTNLILAQNDAHESTLHVAEIVFLTITDRYANFYLDLLGKQNFLTKKSAPYFTDVQFQMERIRGEILD